MEETGAGSRARRLRTPVPEADLQDRLRALPSVDELLKTEPLRSAAERTSRSLAVAAARSQLELTRNAIQRGNGVVPDRDELAGAAAAEVEGLAEPSLRPVINATGVVVHTNLGRAPLAEEALDAVAGAGRGYSNLELELDEGIRGSRHTHVEDLICELTGAEAGFAVNNNAAAVLLALAALARDREVVISRGQLVEIGGSFRIPEILASSGARLVEVGTTNRTRIADYERAIRPGTAALMRVHTSNFRVAGFTEEVAIGPLCELAHRHELPVIDDLGSGVLDHDALDAALGNLLREEPSARRSIAAGAHVVCFSGDKLLGGPQAGLIAGTRQVVDRLRSHPVARAVRIDKLSLAALEATLRLHRNPDRALRALPVARMLSATEEELAAGATRLCELIDRAVGKAAEVKVVLGSGCVGGGALPLVELEGPVVSVTPASGGLDELQARLRSQRPPIIARVSEGALLLDPRTIADDEVEVVATGVVSALS
jgi:L-seryl-tRNA(Ser) seleniumtransferase